MARWTDESEYPILPSLSPTDKLMIFRPGTGQRQVAASNLPGGAGGGNDIYDLHFQWQGLPEPEEADTLVVPRRVEIDLTTFDFFVVAFDEAPTASVTVTIFGVAPTSIQVTFNTDGEMTNLNGAAIEEVIEPGTKVRIEMPATPDATMSGVYIALKGRIADEGS